MSDDANLFVFYRTDDLVAAKNAAYLVEGGKPVELQQGWSFRVDPPHTTGTQRHVHVMLRTNDVSIINRDGHSEPRDHAGQGTELGYRQDQGKGPHRKHLYRRS